jgi:4-amino-4-deoxy-L-arabinose transferase-like glycosyltransferase
MQDHLPYSSQSAQTPAATECRLGWRNALLLLAFSASLLTVNLGGERSLTRHEVVTAQPAKEMIDSGQWLVASVGGVPYTDKPPLSVWMIAGSITLFQSESEFVVRLPNVCCAVLTALLVGVLAARWFGSRIGLIAGLVHVSSYYLLQVARLAERDMPLIAAVTAAMTCFALANLDSPRGRSKAWWLPACFYLSSGLAYLAKGPIGLFFIFAACGLFVLLYRDWRVLRFFLDPAGLVLLVVSTIPYSLLAVTAHPPLLDALLMHNVGRFSGEMGTNQHPLSTLYHFPFMLLPWFPFLAWAFVSAWRSGQLRQPLWGLAICWLVPGFVVVSMSAFKSKHYLSPLLPGFAPLTALGIAQFVAWRVANPLRFRNIMLLMLGLGCAGGAAAVYAANPPAAGWTIAVIGMLALGVGAMLLLAPRLASRGLLVGTFAMVWLIIAAFFSFIMPRHDSYRDQTTLAGRVNAKVPSSEVLYLVHLPDNQITYYLRQPLRRIDGPDEFQKLLGVQARPVYLVGEELLAAKLMQHGQVRVLDRCDSVVKWMTPQQRLTLMEWVPAVPTAPAASGE